MSRFLLILVLLASSALHAQSPSLTDFPFWELNAGWWRSDNTYFDKDLNYMVRSYNSVIHIEIDGRNFRETEYKSYSPSKLAIALGKGKVAAGEGLETVTVNTGELIDDAGTVRITSTRPTLIGVSDTTISPLDSTNGARITRDPDTGQEAYRMLIALPTPEHRYVSNLGLVSQSGELRGFSLFRGTRIPAGESADWRGRYRRQNNVTAVITAGEDGRPIVTRLTSD